MIIVGRHAGPVAARTPIPSGPMTHDSSSRPAVLQMRLVVETDEFEAALRFYRDALGLPQQAAYEGEGDARVVILDAGHATLELVNAAQRRMIDRIEVGRDASPRLRVAFEVPDCTSATSTLASAGATVIGPPVETPWRSLNARLEAPAGLQLTLFEELEARPVEA